MRIYSMMEIENDHLFFGCMGGEFGLYDIKNNKIKHSYDHERRVTAWFLEKNDQSWMYDHKDRMMDKRKQRVNKKVYKKTMEVQEKIAAGQIVPPYNADTLKEFNQ